MIVSVRPISSDIMAENAPEADGASERERASLIALSLIRELKGASARASASVIEAEVIRDELRRSARVMVSSIMAGTLPVSPTISSMRAIASRIEEDITCVGVMASVRERASVIETVAIVMVTEGVSLRAIASVTDTVIKMIVAEGESARERTSDTDTLYVEPPRGAAGASVSAMVSVMSSL